MNRFGLTWLCLVLAVLLSRNAAAVKSGELYTGEAYGYGRYEARVRVTAGDGVVSAFFLWKEGSEVSGTFWNELDFEKIGATCVLQTNALYGNPAANHTQKPSVSVDLCADFHVYGMEWTADYIAWFLDGKEIRREMGETAAAFAQNASAMQVHFNIWPGDASFGGNFSPSILPVHQYIDWAQFSAYENGAFTLTWREDFTGTTVPSGWLTGDWESPKAKSTHDPLNVNFLGGYAVLSLTADDATGPTGAMSGPDVATGGAGGMGGSGGMPGTPGGTSSGGAVATGGTAAPGGSAGADVGGTTGGVSAGGNVSAGGQGNATSGGTTGAGATVGTTTGGTTTSSGGTPASSQGGSAAPTGGVSSGGATSPPSTGGNPVLGGAPTTGDPPAADTTTTRDGGCSVRALGAHGAAQPGIGAALLLALAATMWRWRSRRARRQHSQG